MTAPWTRLTFVGFYRYKIHFNIKMLNYACSIRCIIYQRVWKPIIMYYLIVTTLVHVTTDMSIYSWFWCENSFQCAIWKIKFYLCLNKLCEYNIIYTVILHISLRNSFFLAPVAVVNDITDLKFIYTVKFLITLHWMQRR